MAFAETAKLAVDLSLKGNLSSGLKNVEGQLGTLERRFGKIGQGVNTIGRGIGTALRNGALIGVAALGGLSALLINSVREGQAAAKVQTVYATAIANSGKVSAQYVDALNAQQTALMNLAGVDDELIKTEQTRLIQMGLTGAQVQKLTPLILDAAKATGKDLLTVTLAVGKAVMGSAGSLAKLGIVLPKTTAATKSQALAALEQQKLQLKANEAQEVARGTLTKSDKAVYAHRKALLDAAIAQQKATDASKKGGAAASGYGTVVDALNKKFGGTTAALSGSLDARLGALRENLANIREEAGIKLLPALTRIVDVAGKDLVPAFGKFVDRILPSVISGVDKFASLLENGGAERGIKAITDALGPMVDMLKIAAEPVKAIVKAFLSLPSQVQGILIGGFAINKLSGGLIGQGIGQIAGGLFQRGSTPANPLFVSDVTGGLGGAGDLLTTAGKAGLVTAAGAIAVTALGSVALINAIQDMAKQEVASGAREGKPIINMSGGARLGGAFPISTFTSNPIPAALRNPDRFDRGVYDAVRTGAAAGTEAGIVHSGIFRKAQAIREAAGFRLSRDELISELHGKQPLGMNALITSEAIALASGNKLRNDPTVAELRSANTNLALLKRAQSDMPADLAAKLAPKIHSLEVAINNAKTAITGAINAKKFILNAHINVGTGPTEFDSGPSGSKPKPKTNTPVVNAQTGFVIKVSSSIRDTNTAQDTRLRWGRTATQVGAQ